MRLDLNSPAFQETLFSLQLEDLKQVISALGRLRLLDWTALYRHTGFRWEAVTHLKAPNGSTIHSLRLSQRIRALAYRDRELLRFISLHPDHDSAYERP